MALLRDGCASETNVLMMMRNGDECKDEEKLMMGSQSDLIHYSTHRAAGGDAESDVAGYCSCD